MVVLSVIGGLLLLLVVACVWESRTGRPEWGRREAQGALTPRQASASAKKQVAATLATAVAIGAADLGGDG